MRDHIGLERAYQRLLLAYPRFYRQHRGLEILTTMLEAAKPGQSRPSRQEALHLLLSGLRCRLAPPGKLAAVVAGVVTLWVALVVGGLGAYIVWDSSPTYPDEASIAGFSESLAGQPSSSWSFPSYPNDSLQVAYNYRSSGEFQGFKMQGWTGDLPAPLSQSRGYESVKSIDTVMQDAHARLQNEGWQTGELVRFDSGDQVFWASRDGFALRMMSSATDKTLLSSLYINIHRTEPDGVLAAAIAGFVIGAMLAWPVMVWLMHRFARAPRRARVVMVVYGLPALFACLVNSMDSTFSMTPDGGDVMRAVSLMYPLANQYFNPLAAIVIAASLLMCLGVLASAPPSHQQSRSADSGSPPTLVRWPVS